MRKCNSEMVEWFMRKEFACLLGQAALQFDSQLIVNSLWPTWSLCHTPFSLYAYLHALSKAGFNRKWSFY
jgi:hypothetical protein